MCGIAGILNLGTSHPIERSSLERMIDMLRHRGPDGTGIHLSPDVGLAHSRLSIIDLEGGAQPICNEDRTLWVIFNGEIFNYLELRHDLEQRGHCFSTCTDTEVIVHLFEEKGERCLEELNGQFAIALWDERNNRLFLARDRMGIRPLFYTIHAGRFYFASEIKSIFAADACIPRAIDPDVLAEIFTFWMPADRGTVFQRSPSVAAGHRAWVDCARRDSGVRVLGYPISLPIRKMTNALRMSMRKNFASYWWMRSDSSYGLMCRSGLI